jgi:hypothetical protein
MITAHAARTKFLVFLALATLLAPTTVSAVTSHVETVTRFLEYNHRDGLMSYEISLRNLESLTISDIELESTPVSLEGAFSLRELKKGERGNRQFTFHIPSGNTLFQPRFKLAYTKQGGERVYVDPGEKSQILVNIDFRDVSLEQGRVDLLLSITNPNKESLVFMELKSENPDLAAGTITLDDLSTGESLEEIISFEIKPGEQFFNPTLYLSYHAFHTSGTKRHRNFYTIIQPDLSRVERLLLDRNAGGR